MQEMESHTKSSRRLGIELLVQALWAPHPDSVGAGQLLTAGYAEEAFPDLVGSMTRGLRTIQNLHCHWPTSSSSMVGWHEARRIHEHIVPSGHVFLGSQQEATCCTSPAASLLSGCMPIPCSIPNGRFMSEAKSYSEKEMPERSSEKKPFLNDLNAMPAAEK
ncbi:hypothetical protein AXG93_392s1000 [Marchantia polymorpha subsp. ruderalis]|uniref:Uncharacterized protein n=1 Tax=Marchantia polymorpha subsp. ruderalis TaxID=1480154 RepID=A0A176WQZ9_MARPO|nr:hypothetical protein AXG93_392s1000 [Marchantia polymorpha subsp. ruderalis]